MKLSEAIRLGAMLKPQGRGPEAIKVKSDATCALGAAREAVGARDVGSTGSGMYDAARRWPWLVHMFVAHPIMGEPAHPIDVIWRLNDCEGWSRDQIAGWIATIEPVEEAAPVREASTELCVK